MYRRGDIVLVPFPFTDLSSTKTRPAVVISVENFQQKTGSFTVAMVTSVSCETEYDYEIKDWQAANLLSPSWVRAKVVTIDPSIVRYKPGSVTVNDLAEIMQKIAQSLGLE